MVVVRMTVPLAKGHRPGLWVLLPEWALSADDGDFFAVRWLPVPREPLPVWLKYRRRIDCWVVADGDGSVVA